jgi:hypothetical protein
MDTSQAQLRCFPLTGDYDGERDAAKLVDKNVRGIGWVLRWAAAILVLGITGIVLLDFAYRISAEQALVRAAAAGIREAAMPRATSHTIEQSIRRELGGCYLLGGKTSVALQSAGRPVKGSIAGKTGGGFTITLSAPVDAALPSWLQALWPWNGHAVITTHAAQAG